MVVDSTPECLVALRYAARRARSTQGWVTMLYVIAPGEFEHWVSVRDVMRQEARAEAEERLLHLAAQVNEYGRHHAGIRHPGGEDPRGKCSA